MKAIIMVILLATTLALAGKTEIIPVRVWPRVLNLSDKQVVNPTVAECVKAGYRLLGKKPITPTGKRIKSEQIIQDPTDETKCKYNIIYEDIPEPPPPPPEVLTNVSASRVVFKFTTSGLYRGVEWMDAPVTNKTE